MMEVNNNNIKKDDKNNSSGFSKRFKYFNEVVTFIVACVSFINGLHGDFLHDDIFAITNNKDVTGKNPLFQTFLNDFWGKPMWNNGSHKSYRPITILTFRLQYSLCGNESFPFHLVNVLLHATVTSLFTWTCQHILQLTPRVTLLTGLLFAVHPIHVEAVTGLVGRAELLSAFFFILCFVFYAKSLSREKHHEPFPVIDNWGLFFASLACGAAALLSKEQGLMVLPVVILYDVLVCSSKGLIKCFTEKKWTNSLVLVSRIFYISSFTLCLLVLRGWIMNGQLPSFQHQDNPASFSPFLVTRCLSYPYLWAYNVFLLLFPSTLCYDWQIGSVPLVETVIDIRNLATVSMFAIAAIYAIKGINSFKNKSHHSSPDIFIIIFIFSVLPFVPASNLLFRVGFVIAERTLYIPSTGYCILIASGVNLLQERFHKYRHNITFSFVFLLCVLLLKTWKQNSVWNTRESLFLSGVKSMPNNAKVHYNYANMLKDKGDIQNAIDAYQVAIRLYPDHASAHNNLGTILPNSTEAMFHFETALNIMPGHPGALINLGARKFNLGNKSEGVIMLQMALDIDPLNVEGLMTLGGMMAKLNRWEEAEYLFKEAITEKPDFAEIYHNYGAYLHLKGDIQKAVEFYQKAFSLDTHNAISMVNAARGLRQLGKLEEAQTILNQALLMGRNIEALDILGLVYFQMGKIRDSVSLYEEIRQENPNNTDIATHYAQVLANNGDVDRAESILLDVLQHNPSHSEALHFLANVLGRKGKHEQALEFLTRAIRLQATMNDNVVLENMYFQQGNHFKDLKHYSNALKSYQRVINLNPQNLKAHVNIGAIFHLKGDLAQAKHHYHTVLELQPGHKIAEENLHKLQSIEVQSQVEKDPT